jgi:16S rRNA U1498 N3-methylase RsmE
VNIILFEPRELGKPLGRWDERTSHLLRVLRKKPGDTFDAGLLEDKLGTGRIEGIRLDGSLFYSLDLHEDPPARTPIRAAVGFPRPIQLKRLLRDLSSLGLEAVDLLGTELGEKSYRDTKLLSGGGARSALIEGAVQARDTRIPVLSVYPSLEAWLRERPWDKAPEWNGRPGDGSPQHREMAPVPGSRLGPVPLLIAADNVRPEGALIHLSPTWRPAILAVGSERGWSDGERDTLEAAGFLRLSMGKRALRTETACVAAAILVMEKIGALG